MIFSTCTCITAAPAGFILIWSPVPLHINKFPLFQGRKFNKVQVANTLNLIYKLSEVQFMCLYTNILLCLKGERPWENYIQYDFILFILKCECAKYESEMPTKFYICLYPTICVVFFFFLDWLCVCRGCVSSQQMT